MFKKASLFLSVFFTLLLLLPSCVHSDPDVDMAYAIMNKHAEYMKQEYNARVFGMGGGFPDKITGLGLVYRIQGPLNIEEARRIMVISSQHLLNMVNSDQKIRPYLANYPFNIENLRYSFFVCDIDWNMINQSCEEINPNNLSYFMASNDDIVYCVEQNEDDPLVDVCREPYKKALEIIFCE